ncbi:hypothetical protein FOT46_04700 [Citrobacter freundii]|uniref:hypothetical protein n=1 Tax=Citrobacter freundii complex TaxID=1344959 RepID=UPI0013D66040|nr:MULTISPECIES: hypothetical protein [Citrobacter freundii complex]EKL0720064.1 hypothetical protein [Citrobacter freundii]EKW2053999.1 hypothetical protein [Citrobacter freundii]MBE0070990.1 hypothetical protein [Citrobacter freundii]MBY5299293.1 hypothetical protein [Citrobacter freundii]NGF01322.1 hypothetical protein [Citrobacter freundii]
MNNFSVAIIKTLLISVGALTIISSVFLITLIFNISMQDGIPAFENIKFTVMLFFTTLLLLIICGCLKLFLSMAIDSRDFQLKKERVKINARVEDVTI